MKDGKKPSEFRALLGSTTIDDRFIVGMDEVGRGSWAGPIVVGAVIIGSKQPDSPLKDSKLLTKLQRARLARWIEDSCAMYALGWAFPKEVDSFGLTEAVRLAYVRAIEQIPSRHPIIIDGNFNYLSKLENRQVECIIRADSGVAAVSAASIIAKVARDEYMTKLSRKYPHFGFESNVGYGTAKHILGIKQFGICDEHRQSYKPIKAMLGGQA